MEAAPAREAFCTESAFIGIRQPVGAAVARPLSSLRSRAEVCRGRSDEEFTVALNLHDALAMFSVRATFSYVQASVQGFVKAPRR